MKISNKDFRPFGKKKKKNIPSLDSLKLISFITATALALSKATQEKVRQQQLKLQKKRQPETDETALIIAGFVGGILAGSITALLLTPESGEDVRKRITSYFDNSNGFHEDVEQAKNTAKEEANQAEKNINGNA